MAELTKEKIEIAIIEIKKEINNLSIFKKALVKFTDSKIDKLFLSFINQIKMIWPLLS